MRIIELLAESDMKDEIVNDLMDVLMAYKRKKIIDIPAHGENGIMRYLHNLGYDITSSELMAVLAKPPFDNMVERTTPDSVVLKSDDPMSHINHQQKNNAKDHVEKAATKVATQAVKDDSKLATSGGEMK